MHSQTVHSDFTVIEALRTKTYWMLMAATSLRLSVTLALNIHLIPILVWRGISEATAAYLVSLFAFGSIIATFGIGWMGDRWRKSLLCSLGTIPTMVMVAILGLTSGQTTLFVYLLPIGPAITTGVIPLNWALIGDFFGRRSYASLRGIMAALHGIVTFFSPIYAGWVFDHTGSYTMALLTFSVMLLIAAFIFYILRHPMHDPR